MSQMTKRIFSFVLCFAMLFGMMPAFALAAAAEETTTVADDPAAQAAGVESDATVPGTESTLTTTVGEETTIYKLTDTLTSGTQYLIVSTNTGDGYGLNNTTTGYATTAATGTYYTAWDGTTGTELGEGTYLTTDSAYLWTATQSGDTWSFGNESTYVGWTHTQGSGNVVTGYSYTNAFAFSGSAQYWTLGTNLLTVNLQTYAAGYIGGSDSYSDYYLSYNSGAWTMAVASELDSTNVYFYEPVTVYPVTQTGEPATPDTTYHMDLTVDGTAVSDHAATVTKVVAGTTAQLGYTFTATADGTTASASAPAGGAYTLTSSNEAVATIGADGLLTFTGTAGQTLIQVDYTWTEDDVSYTVSNYVTVTAQLPTYRIEISEDGTTASADQLFVRGVTASATKELSYLLTYEGVNGDESVTPTSGITWSIVEEESDANIAVINQAGQLTFTGNEGTIKVKVSYKVDDNTSVEDIVTIAVYKSTAITPDESTTDFPRWPNPGAVRYDKTAQAVGNFSNTGIAQLELSMAGIPVKTGGAVDVILVVDLSSSMEENSRLSYAQSASKAFVTGLAANADNRLAIVSFNTNSASSSGGSDSKPGSGSGSSDTTTTEGTVEFAMQYLTADNVTTANDAIDKYSTATGTNYISGLHTAQSILDSTKTEGRQQFVVFLSDGAPTRFRPVSSTSTETYENFSSSGDSTEEWISDGARSSSWEYEYYTTAMKAAGVTVYTVGLGLDTTKYQPQYLLNDMSGPAYEETNDTGTAKSKLNTYYFEVADSNSADALSTVFSNIAEKITSAATNVNVADQITEHYEMIFDWPSAVADTDKVDGQEFYIEVVDYPLDETTHERTGDSTILQRIYLNSAGTAITKITYTNDSGEVAEQTIAPTFKAAAEGEDAYFNWTDSDSDGVADAGEYSYVPEGNGTHHMATGAFVELNTDGTLKSLHGVYFTYVVATKTLNWTVTSMSEDSEIALRYFLYLTGSLESVAAGLQEGDAGYVAPGTYPTNVEATLNYTNHLGNDCLQYFPKPQLTWNGAQVSYVFYLVNENGEPVNRAGRVVTFAEAVFVTDTYTEAVVWNKDEGVTELNATKVAQDLLPADYTLYDSTTQYAIHVFQNENGEDIYNYFIITAGNGTTKVYNTKAGTKYSEPGTYASTDSAMSNFDFANTTVAFAVTWQKKLVPDAVVVDFGLPVDIDVVANDFVYNYITGISATNPGGTNYVMNTGTPQNPDTYVPLSATEITVGGHKAVIQDENNIRFTPGSGTSMEFTDAVTFYYETKVDAYEDGAVNTTHMYSSVTVIPATTIYYEDDFLTLTSYTKGEDGTFTQDATSQWTTDGTKINGTQDQDRPGEAQISDKIDADNNYGYDSAYETVSTHSMGSAAKINVNASNRGEATFTFYGTGFDIISMTSNSSGTLIVQLFSGASATGTAVKSLAVDTYYGYTQDANGEWVTSVNNPNALYQVPVMKMSGLTYGQYTVKLIAGYNTYLDNVEGSSDYDLYLDAVRIYDPTGVASGSTTKETVSNAYVADGEGWPQYIELRNNIIAAEGVTVDADGNVTFPEDTTMSGAIFIDSNDANTSIVDYVSYGPNNELYLAAGQSVAFALDQTNAGIIADVQIAMKLGNGSSVAYEIYNAATDGTKSNTITGTLTTATDLYYSIKNPDGDPDTNDDLTTGNIVIKNTSGGILSITNIKVTYTQNPYGTTTSSEEELENEVMTTSLYVDEEVATAAVMSLRSMPAAEEPETEATEPETEATEPETEVTEPETTEPETEATEPETTEPETEDSGSDSDLIEIIKKLFAWLFG